MFKNILGSINDIFKSGDKKAALAKLSDAVKAALADNSISAEEMAQIMQMQKDLGITEEEMVDVKVQILDSLAEKINADGTVGEEEIKLFNEVKTSLGSDYKMEVNHNDSITKEDIAKGLESMKGFLLKVKDKAVDLSGSVYDKAKEIIHKDDKKEEGK